MIRIWMLTLVLGSFLTGLHAQNTPEGDRVARADLTPFELRWKTESDAFVQFKQNQGSLYTAFAAGDQSRTTAYEALLQSAMRTKIDRMQTSSTPLSPEAKARLAQMTQILSDFEGHAFQIGQTEDFAPFFQKLKNFYLLMEAEMDALDVEARR